MVTPAKGDTVSIPVNAAGQKVADALGLRQGRRSGQPQQRADALEILPVQGFDRTMVYMIVGRSRCDSTDASQVSALTRPASFNGMPV